MAYTKQSKNTSTWVNKKKHVYPSGAGRFGIGVFGTARFGAQTTPTWTKQSKNTSSYTNQTKN